MSSFSNEVIALAQKAEKDYGVPASVTLAQYAYESGWGKSGHAINHNNYFGMKYRNGAGNTDKTNWYMSRGAKWQGYSSMAESFDDHGKLLSSEKYKNLTKNATTVEQYVNSFAETYAPQSDGNNEYAKNILSLIKQYDLTQYDSGPLSATASTSILESVKVSGELLSTPSVSGVTEEYKWYQKEFWIGILGDVVKFLVILGIVVLAFILIMKAFNIPMSKKALVKKAIDKTVGDVEE